jgi:hypothetical protein
LLEARMDAWAAFLAIDDAYAVASIDAGDSTAALADVVDSLVDSLEDLDAALRLHPAPLHVAAGTSLISNWRTLLSPAYRACPPWWLAEEAAVVA